MDEEGREREEWRRKKKKSGVWDEEKRKLLEPGPRKSGVKGRRDAGSVERDE